MAKTTAVRLTNQQVQARTATGAPRLIRASIGTNPETRDISCACPTPGECSHIMAVRALLRQEQTVTILVPRVAY